MPRLGNGFGGFPSEAFRFYELLEADNTKGFWTRHKGDYEEFVRAPFVSLSATVATEFGPPSAAPPQRIGGFAADRRWAMTALRPDPLRVLVPLRSSPRVAAQPH